jgi:hypothetical protein
MVLKIIKEELTMRWLLWPFQAIFGVVSGIVKLTGRLVAVVIGLVLLILGGVLSLTVIGAIIGVPIALFGFLLIIRGFW